MLNQMAEYRHQIPQQLKSRRTIYRASYPLKWHNSQLRHLYGPAILKYRAAHPDLFVTPHALTHDIGPYVEWYYVVLAAQNGMCAIPGCGATHSVRAGKTIKLSVDHCHATGVVRGLLCSRCNTSLGQVADDPALLRELAIYLETHQKVAAACVATD
jgi:hypothetical protein